uniref:Putative retrotransposon Ty1-copia subclass protein n=1 Tax=Tanacetum cinerariifolium TaxID=118510 RepID=A0A6L2KYU1_TANCI|nr:putative retrotransposon Ty1-copia subclass protein [Tanacetum cinerariifolium]
MGYLHGINYAMKLTLFDVINLPPNGKTVGSKWFFQKKTDMDGKVHTYNARLVVKGFTQTYKVDYKETFSSIADIRAIRILIAITAFYDYEIWKMDVNTTFVNGHLFKEQMNHELLKVLEIIVPKFITFMNSGLGIAPIIKEPIKMYCYNTKAIAIANESGITKGSRNYCAKVHYLHEVIEFDDIKLEKVHTDENLADPFIKALPFNKHSEHTKNIECSSCEALYTRNCSCSKGNVEDKILVPKPPKNYASTNVVNAPQEPFVVKQDHGVKSSQNPPHVDKCCCECGNALDGIHCQQCICKSCGKGAHIGYNCPPKVPIISNPKSCNQTINNEPPQTLPSFDPPYYSEKEKSVPCVSKPNFVDKSSKIFNPPPQPPIYSCEFCGSNAQYGHYCVAPFNNPEPGPHENFQCQPVNYCEPNPSYDSYYSGFDQFGNSHPQQYLCCENCGGPHETFQCQPTNEDYYHEQNSCYNSNSFGSDHCQPPKYTANHPIFNAHNDFLNSQNELSIAQNTIMEQMTQLTSMCEMLCQIVQKKQEEKRIEEEQAASARYWKIPACCNDDDDYDYAITPEETDNSLSMGDEHLDTIPATGSDEVIKSSVENLVLIPSESEGIPDTMCDVHLVNNPTTPEAKDHFEIVTNSNDDISSSDDDSLYKENIEYVEASPHDSELVSLEAAEIVIPKEEEIKDDNLREKLLNVHLLIANIEALKDNHTPSSKFLTKSSSTSSKSLLEETNTFHNSLLEFENFYFDLEEISSGSTTTHSDTSLSDYEAFYFDEDHIKKISSGSTTTHFDISLSEYDSFIFDFTHEEFVDELAHIISPPEYDCFYF